jgi:hypothetical protein
MHQNNQLLGQWKRQRREERNGRDERRKIAGIYEPTNTHETRRAHVRREEERKRGGGRESERTASSSNRHGRRSRNRGTTTPVSSPLLVELPAIRANYEALLGAESYRGATVIEKRLARIRSKARPRDSPLRSDSTRCDATRSRLFVHKGCTSRKRDEKNDLRNASYTRFSLLQRFNA